jgi:hypothetical protein
MLQLFSVFCPHAANGCFSVMKRYVYCFLMVIIQCSAISAFAQFDGTRLVVRYDSAWTFKNLKLIPVRYEGVPANTIEDLKPGAKIITLSDALRDKKIKIKELPPDVGADLSVLKLTNESNDFILINSGEVVTGGKQDRASGETVLLPPVKDDYFMKTYCMEKGRWTKKEKPFRYFKPADISVKKKIDIEKNQAHVWQEIDRQFNASKLESDTWAYPEIALKNSNAEDSSYIRFFTEKFRNSDSLFAGFIAVTAGRIIATDLYATPQLVNNAFQAIIHTYVKEAVAFGATPVLKDEVIIKFMQPIFSDAKTRKEFLAHHGTIHYYQGKPIHIVAYGSH